MGEFWSDFSGGRKTDTRAKFWASVTRARVREPHLPQVLVVGDTEGGTEVADEVTMAAPDGLEDKGGDTTVRAPRAALSIKDFRSREGLGAGSFAQVLQAKLNRTGKSCALKIMDKHHIVKQGKAEYVLRERVLDALRHEGLINLCYFSGPSLAYLGLELCTKVIFHLHPLDPQPNRPSLTLVSLLRHPPPSKKNK